MKSLTLKLLLAALSVLTAAHVADASASVAGGLAGAPRFEASRSSAEVQRRAARRRTTRRTARPAATPAPAGARQQPARGGAKDDGATPLPGEQTQQQVVTGDPSTLGLTAEEALAVAIREALRKPREGETRARGVLTRVECGPENAALFHVRVGDKTLKLDGGDLKGVHFMAFTPRETGSEIVCGPRKLDHPVVVTYRPEGAGGGGKLVAVEFVPANFKLDN